MVEGMENNSNSNANYKKYDLLFNQMIVKQTKIYKYYFVFNALNCLYCLTIY